MKHNLQIPFLSAILVSSMILIMGVILEIDMIIGVGAAALGLICILFSICLTVFHHTELAGAQDPIEVKSVAMKLFIWCIGLIMMVAGVVCVVMPFA